MRRFTHASSARKTPWTSGNGTTKVTSENAPLAATTSASPKTATTEAAVSTKAIASATSKTRNFAPHGKNCKRVNSTSNYAIKATSKADAEYANIEKYAEDAEHEPNSTQATSLNQTQPATTSPKSCKKTPKYLKNFVKTRWVKNNKPTLSFTSFYK